MQVEILGEAEQDLVDGARFYEAQEPGLGEYFLDSLFSDVDSLQLYAGIHPVQRGYHRLLSKRFPYAVYYRLQGSVAQVWAILDCRQDPEKIVKRLRQDRS
jgi:plasmid stabilization system protein ParE